MNDMNYLDFERPIADLVAHIDELKRLSQDMSSDVDITKELSSLEKKNLTLTKKIFSNLTAWQISQISRHPNRPYTLDYIERIFTDFHELSGDRAFADDKAIVGGLARLNGMPVMVIGQQKGRDIKERTMGYRKAARLMKLTEKFHIPLVTLIDTPGAYPGVGAEERSQAGAIAENLKLMSDLRIPVVCTVIGEGGSGGALAIGVGDRVNMMQYSTYSVISPEGCASILWKSADKAPLAAEQLNFTAGRLKELGLIDNVVPEPLGGAHRNYDEAAANLKQRLVSDLNDLLNLPLDRLIEQRYTRIMHYGYCD